MGTRGTPTSWYYKACTHSLGPSLCSPCGPSFLSMCLINCCHPICPVPGCLHPHSPASEDFLTHHVGEQRAIKTVITSRVMLNQVQGSCPLGFLSGHPRTSFYPYWMSEIQIREQQALAGSIPRSWGISGAWLACCVFMVRAWHPKNAVRRKAVFCGGRPKRHC